MNENSGSGKRNSTPAASSSKGKSKDLLTGKTVLKVFLTALVVVLCLLFVIGSAVAGVLGGGVYAIVKTTPMLDAKVFKTIGFNSYVYDSENNVIAELKREENRVWIDYNDIPDMLIKAVIAREDKRFFEHPGIDFRRIGSAALLYAKKMLGANVDIEGGSTITQQLIKNLTKKDQTTLPRKFQEQWQAMQLEKVLSKEEILAYYLNNIPMGGNFYGIETAAKGYFGKDVRELSLAECASLIGITNNPSKFMPIDKDNIEANIERTKVTLGLMLEQGKITQSEYDEAVSEKIAFIYNPQAGKIMQSSKQSYFVDEAIRSVKESLIKTYGYKDQAALDIIYNSGLHIYTTMQPNVQKALDEVYTDPKFFDEKNKYTDAPPQSAMVIMGKDGLVRGLYGGQGSKEGSVFNRATQAQRSPGSSIKPLIVYGPGIDCKKMTAATVVDDVKQYLDTKTPNTEYPRNVERGRNFGLTTARIGLLKSRNVVASLLLRDYVGFDTALNYLAKMGMDRKKEQYISVAMGGFEQGMTPLQMAAGFSTFLNKGVYIKPIFFTTVKDNTGNVILENKPERTSVFSEQTVFILNDMMADVVKSGTAKGDGVVSYKNKEGKTVTIPSAGKTGTSNDNKDKWFCGFTPYYVGATWYGFDKAVQIENSKGALKIWNAVMNKIHNGLPSVNFFEKNPPKIVKRTICIDSGKLATDLCKADPRGGRVREEYFIEGTEPAYSDTCTVHVTYKACTASKDALGRNLIASEFCPANTVVDKVAIKRPVEYKPKFPNDKYPEDAIFEIPEGEVCTVHGTNTLIPPQNEEILPPLQEAEPITDEATPEGSPNPGVGMVEPPSEDIGDSIQEENWDGIDWGDNPDHWN